MQEITTIAGLRQLLDEKRRLGGSVGFVATMGALHEGHVSLMAEARAQCDVVVTSVFVNPLQFGAGEDLAQYPRTIDSDRARAEAAGVDVIFVPSENEMYPGGAPKTNVTVADLARTMEGALRPGHFVGVATVVNKLFWIVGPCRAYFGEKDWQQLQVIRQMVLDQAIPVDVVGCATVREADGVAQSSRNAYLSEEARAAAAGIPNALFGAQAMIKSGERSAAVITNYLVDAITAHNVVVNYADAVDLQLKSVMTIDADTRLCISASVWGTNLIDNVGVEL